MDRFAMQTVIADQGPDDAVRSRARLAVAASARDAQDCRGLLEMLGLAETGPPLGRICPACGGAHYRTGQRWEARFCTRACAEPGHCAEPGSRGSRRKA